RATVGPASSRAPSGDVAEWLRSGLQNRLRRFNSGRRLHFSLPLPTSPGPKRRRLPFRAAELCSCCPPTAVPAIIVLCSIVALLCGKPRNFNCYTSIYWVGTKLLELEVLRWPLSPCRFRPAVAPEAGVSASCDSSTLSPTAC